MPARKLEICCYTVESALLAQEAGADRIEFCDNYQEGGTTPSSAAIEYVVQKLSIPVNVIVRPRGGDFLYSAAEFEVIKNDILKIKGLGANGVVTGFLKANGDIDLTRTREIVKLAGSMEVTFHRAFDMCRSPFEALGQLIDTGITRILTSGGKNRAADAVDTISEMINKAGDKMIVMPGSGITDLNLPEIMRKTKAVEFHSSAKKFISSKMQYFNSSVSMGGKNSVDEFKVIAVDEKMIKKMKRIISDV